MISLRQLGFRPNLHARVLEARCLRHVEADEQRGERLDAARVLGRAAVVGAGADGLDEFHHCAPRLDVVAADEDVAVDGLVERGQHVGGDVVERAYHGDALAQHGLRRLGRRALGRHGGLAGIAVRERHGHVHKDLPLQRLRERGQRRLVRAPGHRQHHDPFGLRDGISVGGAFDRPRRAGDAGPQIGRDVGRAGGIARAHDDVDSGERATLRQATPLRAGASDQGDCHEEILPLVPGAAAMRRRRRGT